MSADKQVTAFIRLLGPLHDKLGLLSCNCPPASGQTAWPAWMPSRAAARRDFTAMLLEVRHPDFCQGEAERALNRMLMERGINRIMPRQPPALPVPATYGRPGRTPRARNPGCRPIWLATGKPSWWCA